MKKLLLLFALLLMGCGASRPVPAWISAGHGHLEAFKADFLAGKSPAVAEGRFKKALEEIKRGGDLDLLEKVHLTRLALRIAALEEAGDEAYLAVAAAGTSRENRNFHLFLKGAVGQVDDGLLPDRYRPFWSALKKSSGVAKSVAEVPEPLSRLVAAAIAVRLLGDDEQILQTAVDTAGQNGWKRPLLAWLGRQEAFYAAKGDTLRAAQVRKRLEVIR